MRTDDMLLVYGQIRQDGDAVVLVADRDAPDGIGCCLAFAPWNGRSLRLQVDRLDAWREEPWADFWLVARQSSEANPYPMRYLRLRRAVCEVGEIRGPLPAHQHIHATARLESVDDARPYRYWLSWRDRALHVWWPEARQTLSLVAPACELGLYCEGSIVRVRGRSET